MGDKQMRDADKCMECMIDWTLEAHSKFRWEYTTPITPQYSQATYENGSNAYTRRRWHSSLATTLWYTSKHLNLGHNPLTSWMDTGRVRRMIPYRDLRRRINCIKHNKNVIKDALAQLNILDGTTNQPVTNTWNIPKETPFQCIVLYRALRKARIQDKTFPITRTEIAKSLKFSSLLGDAIATEAQAIKVSLRHYRQREQSENKRGLFEVVTLLENLDLAANSLQEKYPCSGKKHKKDILKTPLLNHESYGTF